MMFKTALLLVSAAAAALTPHHVRRHLTTEDITFLNKAAMGNNYEIQAANLATTLATNDADNQYAQMMLADHAKLGAAMQAAVDKSDNSFKLPMAVDAKQQSNLDKLRKADKNFSGVYKDQMQSSHDDVHSLFKDYLSKPSANTDVKSVVSGAMPTVQKHISMAKALPDK